MRTKRISADEAHEIRKTHLRNDADGRGVMLKMAKAPPSWDAERRSARYVMTSQATDRYGDVVVTAGLDTTEFLKNPQAFLFHNSRAWSVGTWDNVEKQLRGRPPRMEGDVVLHPPGGPVKEVDQAAWMIEHGGLKAASIGFIPNWDAVELILDGEGEMTGGLQFNQAEIVECSLVGVPANPAALAKSLDAGVKFPQELLEDMLERWRLSPEGILIERDIFERDYQVVKREGLSLDTVREFVQRLDNSQRKELLLGEAAALEMKVMTTVEHRAVERAARNKRLQEQRLRDLDLIRRRG